MEGMANGYGDRELEMLLISECWLGTVSVGSESRGVECNDIISTSATLASALEQSFEHNTSAVIPKVVPLFMLLTTGKKFFSIALKFVFCMHWILGLWHSEVHRKLEKAKPVHAYRFVSVHVGMGINYCLNLLEN